MAYMEFADGDAARDGLRAAVEYLMAEEGCNRWQIEDLVSEALAASLEDEPA